MKVVRWNWFVAVLLLIVSASGVAKPLSAVGHYRKLDDRTYLVVLEPGAELVASLAKFKEAEKIASGVVSGVGVTRNNVLGYYKFNNDGSPGKTHTESVVQAPREIVALNCVMATAVVLEDGTKKPAPPHCHIALAGGDGPQVAGSGFPVVGGHLIAAEVAVTVELVITVYDTAITKRPSAQFGGTVIDISEKQGGKSILK